METKILTKESGLSKLTKSAEMRNVTLSDNTKEFLVAHHMTQEIGDYVAELMGKYWNPDGEYIDEEMSDLWMAVGDMQDQIMRIMTEAIKENLKRLEVIEI